MDDARSASEIFVIDLSWLYLTELTGGVARDLSLKIAMFDCSGQ
jgi:hypothetical protein